MTQWWAHQLSATTSLLFFSFILFYLHIWAARHITRSTSLIQIFLSIIIYIHTNFIECMTLRSKARIYGWFRQLFTSVCTSSSSIWLPLCECLLPPKRTLREFFQIFFPSNYWVFKNAYLQSFFVRIRDLKKKYQNVTLCKKKSQFFEKNTIFSIAMQESFQNRKLTSSATSILNFIYIF